MKGYHNVIITYSNASAPREEWCLLLKSLSKCVAEVSKLFWCSNVTSWSEIATSHDNTAVLDSRQSLTSLQTHLASAPAGEGSFRPSEPERGWGFGPGELTSASQTLTGRSLCQSEHIEGRSGTRQYATALLTRNKSWRSSQRSWTKFMSLTLGSSKSFVSWENGTWTYFIFNVCQIPIYYYDPPWHRVARPSGRGKLSRSPGAWSGRPGHCRWPPRRCSAPPPPRPPCPWCTSAASCHYPGQCCGWCSPGQQASRIVTEMSSG